jgi:hypothetical protein
VTKKTLEGRVWWWNHFAEDGSKVDGSNRFFPANNCQGVPHGLMHWSFGQDAAAFCYELARRHDRSLNLRPYPKLSWDEVCFLGDLFRPGKARTDWCYTHNLGLRPLESKPGYSVPSVWKLGIPDNTLIQAFTRFIHEQRAANNVQPKKTPSETSKAPAWGLCEALDREFFLSEKDGGSDPGRKLRRAKEKARESADMICVKLAEISQSNPGYRKVILPDFPDTLVR